MNKYTYWEALKWASLFVNSGELDAGVAPILLEDYHNWSYSQLVQNYRQVIPEPELERFKRDIKKVIAGEPVQYVTNMAYFFGRLFYVDNRVLIPRMETEELVEQVLKLSNTLPSDAKVLDIGTGSGDIAITLKLERPSWRVSAGDLSKDALQVATKNATQYQTAIDFRLGSIFEPFKNEEFDLIVSNPPYIAVDEQADMDQSVLDYEPKMALFADHNGLYWYEKIADQLIKYLRPNGWFICEIGFRQGQLVQQIFQEKLANSQVQIIKDINQQDRMILVRV